MWVCLLLSLVCKLDRWGLVFWCSALNPWHQVVDLLKLKKPPLSNVWTVGWCSPCYSSFFKVPENPFTLFYEENKYCFLPKAAYISKYFKGYFRVWGDGGEKQLGLMDNDVLDKQMDRFPYKIMVEQRLSEVQWEFALLHCFSARRFLPLNWWFAADTREAPEQKRVVTHHLMGNWVKTLKLMP